MIDSETLKRPADCERSPREEWSSRKSRLRAARNAARSIGGRRLVGLASCALVAMACGSSDDEEPEAASSGEVAAPSDAEETDFSSDSTQGAEAPPAVATAPPAATAPPPAGSPAAEAPAGAAEQAPVAADCNARQSYDDIYELIQSDLARNVDDSRFLRYVSLSNSLNRGLCGEGLEQDRMALVQALNSLSTEAPLVVPQPIDREAALYRIDIRDFGWDEPVVVAGVAFEDKWEALVEDSAYAVAFEGDIADQLPQFSGTSVPVIQLDALIDSSMVGDLYYALVGVPENAFVFFAQLGLDFDEVVRAGTTKSIMSRQDALVQSFDVANAGAFYWSRLDIAQGTGAGVVADPLEFPFDLAPALFTLPNGMLGYALFSGQFVRLSETGVLFDRSERDGLMKNGLSCSSCHFAGVLPVIDEVLPFAEANPTVFNSDEIEEVQDSFWPQAELNERMGRDNRAYKETLTRLGLGGLASDPMSSVYRRFDSPVTLDVAAAELGVETDALLQQLPQLSQEADPALAVLANGSMQRADFDGAYVRALCFLLNSAQNRPAAGVCGL